MQQADYQDQPSLVVRRSVLLHLHRLEVQVGYYHANIVTPELQIWKVPDFRGIFLVAIVLLPTSLALVHQCTCSRFSVLVLINEATDFS